MPIRSIRFGGQAGLGDVWLRDPLARLAQKRAQFGRHHRIDADALLARAARTAGAARAAPASPAADRASTEGRVWRAVIAAIEHGSRPESRVSHAAAAAAAR